MDLTALVERLSEARQTGDHAPDWLNGALTLEQALDVQLGLLERKLAEGDSLAGWKVGLTSERARTALGVDERPFGYVLTSRVQKSGARLRIAGIARPAIEAEMCFTIGRRIQGDHVSRDEIAGSVARVAAGYELNERRPGSARPDFCAMVTDCLSQWGIVEGEGLELADAGDLGAVRCTLTRNGEQVYTGLSRDELDDHLNSLSRLAAVLSEHGRALEPGQKVITGAFARFETGPGQHWRADYEGIGRVEVTFE